MPSVEAAYYCGVCTPERRTVQAPLRRDGESLELWTTLCLIPAVYLHHRIHSPDCRNFTIARVEVASIDNLPIGTVPAIN